MERDRLTAGIQRWLTVGVLGGVLGIGCLGCSSAPPRTEVSRDVRAAEEACFSARRVRSISPLHEMYALVELDRRDLYLLTMERLCPGLPFASSFAISATFTRVCSGSQAKLSYLQAGGRGSCGILRVERVPSIEAARELVAARTPSRHR